MTSIAMNLCQCCARFHRESAFPVTCEAFPKGIPDAIFDAEADHREPFKGDRGLQFVLAQGRDEEFKAAVEQLEDRGQDHGAGE